MFASQVEGDEPLFPSARRALQWAAVYLISAVILLLPAIWNGFPFVFADTAGYLDSSSGGNLSLGRSALYGAFLALGIPLDFWPTVLVQALIGAWVIRLVLRVHGFERPATVIATAGALCLGTSLPWYAGQLMPDIFLPVAILALYLLAFASSRLRGWDIAALVAIVAFAIAAHMSVLAILLIQFAVLIALWAAAARTSLPRPRLSIPAASIAAGAALALASNYAIAGVASFTPGGSTFLFARLLQDGFVKTYLERNCPSQTLALCHFRDGLPKTSDDWLWDGDGPLVALGGWQAFAPEADRIIVGSILEQPIAHMRAILIDTIAQLGAVATGDGFDAKKDWYTQWKLRDYAPDSMPRFQSAAQQHNAIDFRPMNRLQVPLALGATFALPILIVLCWRRRAATTMLALSVFVAVIANAAVCAAFSAVDDRYQSRIISIAVLAAALACYELLAPWFRLAPRPVFARAGQQAGRRRTNPRWPEYGDVLPTASDAVALAPETAGSGEDHAADAIELTILMPCLNEAETISTCVTKARSFMERRRIAGEVLVADNGSTDHSAVLASRCGARVVAVTERGYGAALRAGTAAARGRFVIMGDADDSYDFTGLDSFVAKLRDGCDLVVGNRFAGGIAPGAMPILHRYVGNPVLSLIGRMCFRAPINDFHCGLRGFRRDAILALDLRTSGMEFASELVARAALAELVIAEVPTTLAVDGRSRPPHLRTWPDGWRHLRFLLTTWLAQHIPIKREDDLKFNLERRGATRTNIVPQTVEPSSSNRS